MSFFCNTRIPWRLIFSLILTALLLTACSDKDDRLPIEPNTDRVSYTIQGSITAENDLDIQFDYGGKQYFRNRIHQIKFNYTSLDPDQNVVTLSGVIRIPLHLLGADATPCEGIILFNHYTACSVTDAPSRDHAYMETFFLAEPLHLNYVMVESDFYGFGITEDKPQAFLQGTVNARASLDALIAAEQLLKERGFDVGPYRFNVGYSSGGYDAMAVQKLRDMEYRDRVSFNKTFSGGGPLDLAAAYRYYVKRDFNAYNVVVPLLMVATNETHHLGLGYEQVFLPGIAEHVGEWILSKKYSSGDINRFIGEETHLTDILQPDYLNLESDAAQQVLELFTRFNIAEGWTPDPTQNIYLFHSQDDDYVPFASAFPLVTFLKEHGFTESQHAGQSNLQTNLSIRGLKHEPAVLVYVAQTASAIKAWATMYHGGKLDPEYAAMLSSGKYDLVEVFRLLDARGLDCRAMLNGIVNDIMSQQDTGGSEGGADSSIDMTALTAFLSAAGIDMNDVLLSCLALGIDPIQLLNELTEYLSSSPAADTPARRALRLLPA